jgi:hypothetical protein
LTLAGGAVSFCACAAGHAIARQTPMVNGKTGLNFFVMSGSRIRVTFDIMRRHLRQTGFYKPALEGQIVISEYVSLYA